MRLMIIGADPVLRDKCEIVCHFDDELKDLVGDMQNFCADNDGAGLAAPQVGVSLRLFVTMWPPGTPRVFINPIIIKPKGTTKGLEKCLSVPNVEIEVGRSKRITVLAQGINGKSFKVSARGRLARIIQHEIDHLDGKLIIDYAGEQFGDGRQGQGPAQKEETHEGLRSNGHTEV